MEGGNKTIAKATEIVRIFPAKSSFSFFTLSHVHTVINASLGDWETVGGSPRSTLSK